MHGTHVSEEEPIAEINMIPMIDVALTLLIILMVTTVFIQKPGVALKLPETVTREGAVETVKDLTIIIDAQGATYVDAQPIDADALQARLRALAATNREARVLIKGDRNAQYARIMDVMDMVRLAGLTRVVFPTDPKTLRGEAAPVPASPPTP
ncbi:MAG: biopolymer transporter ExbD [Chloroherpetonaceae bacterium]|nr:biopolymer transporter ExbD [Chthonomonadaceae bacterium]MDW8208143.1 biopolymer transporter ExbD [Chloroherpetonaceae bacterium]